MMKINHTRQLKDNDGFKDVDGVELMTSEEIKKREELMECISNSMRAAADMELTRMLRGGGHDLQIK